ncbi:MAG TPA: methionine synthase [Candidatus Wunengus sp. YC60]|uniref:methionine synthase n=1 Tax=Candidatus Wunengus sp. YC60 TaxID=3367697 RepID=UPI004028435C
MTTNFQGNFSATAIGSLPHTDVETACDIMFNSLPEIPCWPELPKISTKEEMCIQYTEGLPCVKIHKDGKTVSIDDTQDTSAALERFYELFLKNDPDLFKINPECSAGFYAMIDRLNKSPKKSFRALKGQVVGPITLAGSLKLSTGITALYSEEFFDVIIKLISMKALWQFTKLSQYGLPVIIFADEPYLTSFGSAFMNISRERAISALNEVYDAVQTQGGLTGTHCCGNTDWAMLMDSKVDIVSFDAYEFMDKYLMYWREIKVFLDRGGYLAWGIVPTSPKITSISSNDLVKRLEEGVQFLVNKGLPRTLIQERSIITPSCGAGTLTIEEAERVMALTHELSVIMKS